MSSFPRELIEKIFCYSDIQHIVGDDVLNKFLIKECKLINPKRLFNAFVRTNCQDSLCFLLLQHKDRLLTVFDCGLVLSAIEYSIKNNFVFMTMLLVSRFHDYAQDKWITIIRTCCIAMSKCDTHNECQEYIKLMKWIIKAINPSDKHKFTLPLHVLYNILSHKCGSKIICFFMEQDLLSFLDQDIAKCEKIIYYVVCYNHVELYNYLPNGEYKKGFDVLICGLCFANHNMIKSVLHNMKIRYYTVGLIRFLLKLVKYNKNSIDKISIIREIFLGACQHKQR
jgi:hypothetical protein